MRHHIFALIIMIVSTIVQANNVGLDTSEGLERLRRAEVTAPLVDLIRYFETQQAPGYCGIATATMLLNALSVEAPVVFRKDRFFNQQNIFTDKVENFSAHRIAENGMQFKEFVSFLKQYGLQVEYQCGASFNEVELREKLVEKLSVPKHYVVVNYYRYKKGDSRLGQGHFSPLGAYDEASDSFLVFDVSRARYAPTWIKTADLHQAISCDPEGRAFSRGVVFVSGL